MFYFQDFESTFLKSLVASEVVVVLEREGDKYDVDLTVADADESCTFNTLNETVIRNDLAM